MSEIEPQRHRDHRAICNHVSGEIIEAAIEVHRHLGPGLLESIYEEALAHEFTLRDMQFERQHMLPVIYKDRSLPGGYRIDFLVSGLVIVELKSVNKLEPVFEAQLLTYLKLSGLWLGLLINFNERTLRQGIKRIVNGIPNIS